MPREQKERDPGDTEGTGKGGRRAREGRPGTGEMGSTASLQEHLSCRDRASFGARTRAEGKGSDDQAPRSRSLCDLPVPPPDSQCKLLR